MLSKQLLKQLLLITALIAPLSAYSAGDDEHLPENEVVIGQHAGDVQPWKIGTQLFINAKLFEGDFGDLPGGVYGTDDPGFDVDISKGGLTPGNWLRFRQQGQLQFWNGQTWVTTVPNQERIELKDALSTVFTYSTSTVSNNMGVIGEVDARGDLHEHLEFAIKDAGNTQGGSIGAYRIAFTLLETQANQETAVAEGVEPIVFILNRGLSNTAFAQAVAAARPADNAVFDEQTSVLTLQDVLYQNQHYYVQLQLQNNHFVLKAAQAATNIQNHAAQFDGTKLIIPQVRALGKYYQAVLLNKGNLQFHLEALSEIN